MTALSSAALDDHKIEGGAELLRAVPNMSFSKANFSMYNISIRGIGTKAISASSDPAVAVSFNNTPLIRNRLFESEFFDLARVEVLRGRSEEHTSELQSLMRISYAVFCLKTKQKN